MIYGLLGDELPFVAASSGLCTLNGAGVASCFLSCFTVLSSSRFVFRSLA